MALDFGDFKLREEWKEEEDGAKTLAIYLPGFSKEQLLVQVSSKSKLRISGERPDRDRRKRRQHFHKEYQIPPNCDASKITAKYKADTLYVRHPLRDREATTQLQIEKEKPTNDSDETPLQKKNIVAGVDKNQVKDDEQDDETIADNTGGNGIRASGNANNKITSLRGFHKGLILRNWVKLLAFVIFFAILIFVLCKLYNRNSIVVFIGETPW